MILITGGAYQGKRTFAEKELGIRTDIVDGAAADTQMLETAKLVTDFHLWVAGQLKAGQDPLQRIREVLSVNSDLVISVNELGCGIVPVDAFDRCWRECVGRVCCELAKEAEAVYRLTCGISVRLK